MYYLNKNNNMIKITIFSIFLMLSASFAGTEVAPSFKTRDIKGKLITSEAINSKGPYIVFFWHSCCGLDKAQLTVLKELHSKYKESGFEIIGIAMDGASKTAKVKKAVSVNKMPWLNIVDKNNEIKDKFNPTAVPTLFVVNNGKINNTFNGYKAGDDAKIASVISALF